MTDSRTAVDAMWEHDHVFRSVLEQLGAADSDEAWEMLYTREGVSKMSPDMSDVHMPGALGTIQRYRKRRKALKPVISPAVSKGILPKRLVRTAVKPAKPKKPKNPGVGALLAAGAGGATALYGAQKLAQNPEVVMGRIFKPKPPTNPDESIDMGKSVDWEGTFSKVDDEKRQVFGWASIVSVNGEPVIDRQGDVIDLEEIEKSAYDYVINSRTGGRQHKRTEDGSAFKASDMIESLVVTPEKKKHIGLSDTSPTGWWVGFKVHDDDTWAAVKRGEVTGFSIHGTGKRVPIEGDFLPQRTEVA